MIVIDASALIELLLNTAIGRAVANRVRDDSQALHAPHLIDLEVAQVLRRLVSVGIITSARALQALESLADLGIARYPHEPLLTRIWSLRANLTAYDAAYVCLAEALAAPLVTCDEKLQRAPGHTARIDVVNIATA